MAPYQYHLEFAEIFRSVEIVWMVWVVSVILFFVMTVRGIRRLKKLSLRNLSKSIGRFLSSENGGHYPLSFVLVFPIYVLIVALILEASFMLVAKMGTIYAAFAASRSAIVWTTVEKPSDRNGDITGRSRSKARQAAVQAMVPFSSGLHPGNSSNSQKASSDYLKAYKAYTQGESKNKVRDEYVLNKYRYADGAVSVSLASQGNGEIWKKDVEATVSYEAPFLLPYVGKLLGGKQKAIGGAKVTCLTIQSKAALLQECPMNDKGALGIRYATSK